SSILHYHACHPHRAILSFPTRRSSDLTNDFFLATPHRAVNRSGGERYTLAFFCDSNIYWPIASVPTCVGPDRPPKYPTTWYTDRSEEHTSGLQSPYDLVCHLPLEKKNV